MRPLAITKNARRILAVGILTAGAIAAPIAGAQSGSVDDLLTVTGQPGPHRVAGNYFTSPTAPAEQQATPEQAIVGPSTPILLGENICTVAASGTDREGNKIAITAGHCGGVGQDVSSFDAEGAGTIGTVSRIVAGDVSVITLRPEVKITRSYGNVTLDHVGGSAPAFLETLCKTGVTSGTSCGPVLATSASSITAHICGSFGDSGAPIYAGNRLVGVLNGGVAGLPSCVTPAQGPVHAPAVGTPWSTVEAALNAGGTGAGFKLA